MNHTCETIRLLQELQEDPVCACHEQDDDDSSEVDQFKSLFYINSRHVSNNILEIKVAPF